MAECNTQEGTGRRPEAVVGYVPAGAAVRRVLGPSSAEVSNLLRSIPGPRLAAGGWSHPQLAVCSPARWAPGTMGHGAWGRWAPGTMGHQAPWGMGHHGALFLCVRKEYHQLHSCRESVGRWRCLCLFIHYQHLKQL
jgi:hypothetical protein